jgi:hypothetical protein
MSARAWLASQCTKRLNNLWVWSNEVLDVIWCEGFGTLRDKLSHGRRFIQTIEDASRPRIVEKAEGRSTIKVDTGLADLGAAKIFNGYTSTSGSIECASTGGGVFIGFSLFLLYGEVVSQVTSLQDFLALLIGACVEVPLLLIGLYGFAWSLHHLLEASRKATVSLSTADRERLELILSKNADVAGAVSSRSCETYEQFAELIVQLRHQIADRELSRAI